MTRKLIISESVEKSRRAAGNTFGYGRLLDFGNDDGDSDEDQFDLKSVDNTYMLFTMTRGWVYTSLWISIAVFFSIRMTKAFRHVTNPSQVFPLAIATATVLALMVSMYTVWAGRSLYVVGLDDHAGPEATRLIDLVLSPQAIAQTTPRRGFEVLNRRPRNVEGPASGGPASGPRLASPPAQFGPGGRMRIVSGE